MKPERIVNPHVQSDHGSSGLCGPAGECRGHVHVCCPVEGVTFQCALCGKVNQHTWDEIDEVNRDHLERWHGGTDTVRLPSCDCLPGEYEAAPFLNHSDVVYGLELPHHYTLKAVQMIAARPAFKALKVNAHGEHERYQGEDFSHLPKRARPGWHRKIVDDERGHDPGHPRDRAARG